MTSINIPLAAAAIFAAAILHILATLATPHLIPTSGYGRLAGDLAENRMQVLPDVMPDAQPLPFFAPDGRYAVCRFDTRNGPISLTAVLPEPGWVLALFSPDGDNFFTSVGSPNRRPEVSILLVAAGDEAWRLGASSSLNVAVTQDSVLTIPANEGLALIRAPDRGEAYRQRDMAELKRATCRPRSRAS
ncbi:hypothetical protein [Hyphomicrobium sp. CS1GBMeth3]|uniref:hypothetical protein n=1 Tax=Hyphomicrobium sp. CS1GBMeth3 TaxID=1892845 RepID=UPI001AEC986B|nr:hypothetical protein [Hyphomicrobium sp. CS1GBMeth3]